MKKVLISSVLAVTLAATPLIASANGQEKEIETSWNHNGVKITVVSNHRLTSDEKNAFEGKTVNLSAKTIIDDPQMPLPTDPYSAITLSGPEYQTFTNGGTYAVINIALAAVNAILTKKISQPTIQAITGAATGYFLKQVPNDHATYWGFSNSKAYSSYYGYYEDYDMQVQYANSNYTSPITVYYYDTGISATGL